MGVLLLCINEFDDMFIFYSSPKTSYSKNAHSYVTGIYDTFFIKIEIFFVVSFKIAPKFTSVVSNFKLGKHS
jgi:hypothetical protein